jgi:drug/metabolite transporter (DMT)-like permease
MVSTTAPTRAPRRLQVVVAFGLVYVLWGSTYLAIRIAVEHLTPLTMGGLRFIVAGLLMLGFRAARGHRIGVGRSDLLRLTFIGFLLLVSSNVVLGWGELYIPTSLAALLVAVIPLWFLLLERITHSTDRLPARGIAGIALGVAGVAVLLWPDLTGQSGFGGRQLFGAFLVLFASVSWAVGSILAKRWQMPIDPYAAAGWQMLFGGAISGALALVLGDAQRTTFTGPGAARSLWAIVYLIVAGSMVGFTAYVWLLKNVPIAKVATYAYVNPIVAMLLGCFFHGEKLDGYMLAGSVVVIVSVILVTGAKVRRKAREAEALELEPIEPSG